MSIASECARLLRVERELHGLTIAEAAGRAGMGAVQLGDIERGKSCRLQGPSLRTLARILSAYPDTDLEGFLLRIVQIAEDELAEVVA